MIKHIVMWKIVDQFEGMTKEQICQKIKCSLESLSGIISQIKFIRVGIDNSCTDMSMDIVLISDFNNKNDLEIYAKHPMHVRAGEYIKQVATLRKVVDFEY